MACSSIRWQSSRISMSSWSRSTMSLSNDTRIVESGGDGDARSRANASSPGEGWYLRRAAMQDVQKVTGSVSEASRESQATGCFCRLAHAESRVVFPLPAEAETRVNGEVWTVSSSASRRERSTRKRGRRGGESLLESNAEDCWEEEEGARACTCR